MSSQGNGTLSGPGFGPGLSAAGDLPTRNGALAGFRSALVAAKLTLDRIAVGLARHRRAAAALRDLSQVEDYVLRDIGLNRSLIDRSDYRITRRATARDGFDR